MMTTKTVAAVVPFDTLEDGTVEPVVAVIPTGYDTQVYLPNWNNLMNVLRCLGLKSSFAFMKTALM